MQAGGDVAVFGFCQLFFCLGFFLFGLDFVNGVAHTDFSAEAGGFEFGGVGVQQLLLCGDLRLLAVDGGEGLPHLQADLLGLGFEFCLALREDFLALFFFAADFAAAVDGDGELYADVSAAVAVAVRVAAVLRDFVAVVLVADVKAQLWPVFALRGGTVAFAFFDLQAAGLDGGTVGNRLVYPLVFALSVGEVGQGFVRKRFGVVRGKAGEVGKAVLCGNEFGAQADFFGVGTIKTRLGFVGVDDSRLTGFKKPFGLGNLRGVSAFFGGDGGEFVLRGEDVEVGFAGFEHQLARGIVQLAVAQAGGDLFGLVLAPARAINERLADLGVPAVAAVFVVAVLGAVGVIGVGAYLRQQARFCLLLRLLCGCAGMARSVVFGGVIACSRPGFVEIKGAGREDTYIYEYGEEARCRHG